MGRLSWLSLLILPLPLIRTQYTAKESIQVVYLEGALSKRTPVDNRQRSRSPTRSPSPSKHPVSIKLHLDGATSFRMYKGKGLMEDPPAQSYSGYVEPGGRHGPAFAEENDPKKLRLTLERLGAGEAHITATGRRVWTEAITRKSDSSPERDPGKLKNHARKYQARAASWTALKGTKVDIAEGKDDRANARANSKRVDVPAMVTAKLKGSGTIRVVASNSPDRSPSRSPKRSRMPSFQQRVDREDYGKRHRGHQQVDLKSWNE